MVVLEIFLWFLEVNPRRLEVFCDLLDAGVKEQTKLFGEI